MNILFANYGDFATNSLNHIAGFANELSRRGHACIVAVPRNQDSVRTLSGPLFIPRTFEEVLTIPNHFPDSQPADIIHAWTPREGVRRFVEAYEKMHPVPVLVHLEDNEEHLLESYYRVSFEELRQSVPVEDNPIWTADLSHPGRYRSFIHLADGGTVITPALTDFFSRGTPTLRLNPPVDLQFFSPRPPDPALRARLGLRADERVVVYHGSVTSANRGDLRKLFLAVALLNREGVPTRLIRTGFSDPDFNRSFGYAPEDHVIDLGYIERDALPELLALADVLVQPGCDDPFNRYRLPSKIPEFLASGRPVIIPRTNIGLELTHEHDVLLLERGDPLEIAQNCRRIFADPDLAARLGKGAVATARDRFDAESGTDRLLEFYERTLERREASHWVACQKPPADQFARLPSLVASLPSRTDGTLEAAGAIVLREAVRSLEIERGAWMEKLKKAVANTGAIERERDARAASAEALTLRIADLNSRLEALAGDRDRTASETRETHEHMLHLDRRVRETDIRLQETVTALDATRHEVQRLNEREARVKASASWKMTAPLRMLRRIFIDRFTRPR